MLWQKRKIGDIAQINEQSYSEKMEWTSVNYLDTGNITANRIDTIQKIDLNKEKLPSRAKRLVRHNSILFSMVRPNQRHFGIIKEIPENFLVSTGFVVIDCDTKYVNPEFVYYFLIQDYVIEGLQAIAEQSVSAYPSIKPSDIEKLEIDIPPLTVQNKIVGILGEFDKKIETQERINHNLESQAYTIYMDWFIDNGEQHGATNCSLSDVFEIFDSRRIPLSSQERAEREKIYPYYGAAGLLDYVDNFIFDGIFVLMGEDGSVVTEEGYPYLQYIWGQFWVNNHAHILQGKNGISTETLYLILKKTNIKEFVTGAVQAKMSQENLRSIPTITLKQDELAKFDSLIQPIFNLIRNNRSEIEKLEELKQQLQGKLSSSI